MTDAIETARHFDEWYQRITKLYNECLDDKTYNAIFKGLEIVDVVEKDIAAGRDLNADYIRLLDCTTKNNPP